MKFTLIAVCAIISLALVEAKPLSVQQAFDFLSIFTNVLAAVSQVAGTVVSAVMTPVLSVVAIVEQRVVAPINNQVTSLGLNVAIDQFCGMLPTIMAPTGFVLPPNSKDLCLKAAKEELKKGFDSNWREPARV